MSFSIIVVESDLDLMDNVPGCRMERIEKKQKMKKMKKTTEKPLSQFQILRNSLSDEEDGLLESFFKELKSHIFLSRNERASFYKDFENALCFYSSHSVTLTESLRRLDPENLGGFYARPPFLWFALDDAAKIYPLSMKHGQMAVFRLSAYIDGPVVPEILQIALDFTIKRFPSFATTVKKGFFWHYLDTCKRHFLIEDESPIPCRPFPIGRSGSQSFRVIHFENRISVEFFHVLTDGNGGLVFLKTLIGEYFRLLGVSFSPSDDVLDVNGQPSESEFSNEFHKTCDDKGASGFFNKSAVQLGGKLSSARPCRIVQFRLDSDRLCEKAKSYGVTVTSYVLALMFLANKSAGDELRGISSIQVPVNMRRYYPSKTVRNFAMYCGIRIPLEEINELSEVCNMVSRQLSEKSSKLMMDRMMSETGHLVQMLRFVPLSIKASVAKVIYGFAGDNVFSNTLSNLGLVSLPYELQKHVISMDFVLGTALNNRASCALVTCSGIATLSISKMTYDPSFEEKLYSLLLDEGFCVEAAGSEEA